MVIEEKSSLFEGAFAIGGILIAIIATFSSPKLEAGLSRAEILQQRDAKAERIAELQASLVAAQNDSKALEAQLVQAGSALEGVQAVVAEREARIDALKVEREELTTRVAATTKQLREMDGQLEELKGQLAEFKEIMSVQEVADERDAALDLAKEKEELAEKRAQQIRELTLQLNRAGVYP